MNNKANLNLSIVIPHYNSWSELNSLLKTIPTNSISVIVVDDNSIDSESNLSEFQEKFPDVTFLVNTSGNKGAGAARNIGINKVSTQWIMFADADDLFIDNFENNINKYFNSKFDVIYFEPTSFKTGNVIRSKRHIPYKNLISQFNNEPTLKNELLLRCGFYVPWAKLIRKSLIDEFDIKFEEIQYSNDLLFSAKIGIKAKEILAVNQVIYSVRESDTSLTSNMDSRKFKIRFNAWLRYVDYLKSNLNEREYKVLNLTAFSQIIHIFRNKLGLKSFFYAIRESYKRNIPIIRLEDFIKRIK
ncbi:glycosyltransferase family 2 protein [Aerococcaceae bacterium INB8]|uniref:Glycosyltransferase family 2 protein n=1 Tax=Ruoffia halotolerans TaxID=2748684 RepID=A0A839A927_9LACT|nr:glycosyltransferase family 2 protein [Ruoffia halotolerans]MBA5730208.1 glycosyltransferase family 2 protein [Ruoffia halotolerans]